MDLPSAIRTLQSFALRKNVSPLIDIGLTTNVIKHYFSRTEGASDATPSPTALFLITVALSRNIKLYFFIDI